MILWLPPVRDAVMNVASPPGPTELVPRTVSPSLKVTRPVVPVVAVAVNVTATPWATFEVLLDRLVVVMAWVMVCVSGLLVLSTWNESPL